MISRRLGKHDREIESHISVGRRYTWNTVLGNWVKFGGKFLLPESSEFSEASDIP